MLIHFYNISPVESMTRGGGCPPDMSSLERIDHGNIHGRILSIRPVSDEQVCCQTQVLEPYPPC